MAKELTQYADDFISLFKSIGTNFRALISKHFAESGFTVPQIFLMQELYHHPEISLIELSQRMGLAKSTVCGIVDRLEKQGAVMRVRSHDDRRTVKISLTEKMYKLQETIVKSKNAYFTEVLSGMEIKEIEELLTALKKLDQLMREKKKN